MSLAFTYWEQAKRPTGPNDLIDSDERRKLSRSMRRFCDYAPRHLSAAKFIIAKICERYRIKRLRDLPRHKLRSALCIAARWSDNSWNANLFGDLSGIVTEDVAEGLGFTSAALKQARKNHREDVLRQNLKYGFNWKVPDPEEDETPRELWPSCPIEAHSNVVDFQARRGARVAARRNEMLKEFEPSDPRYLVFSLLRDRASRREGRDLELRNDKVRMWMDLCENGNLDQEMNRLRAVLHFDLVN